MPSSSVPPKPTHADLGRRERQIVETVYAKGRASVTEVLEALPDPPSYSAVRAILNILEEKGHLRSRKEGKKFIYEPAVPRAKASRSALKNLITTFFGGSAAQAVASLIELDREKLTNEDLDRLSRMIEEAKKGGRAS